ncbi:MAG: sel1 repeat family protein, partial [Rhodospirillales bacterium]|nr:sel1 repeat family protein [Rhodospirillales bacterium]
MRRLALATASLLRLAAPALADLAAGRAAFEAGDYAAAVQALEPAAWEGQAEAQFLLARCHENGWGVPRSEPRAFAWYKRAGDKAHPEAQLRLGELFELGQGVPISLRQAADWYRRAANTGQMRAKTRLGLINLHGRGQRPNLVRAAALLGEAAAAGDAEARAALDDMARRGLVKAMPQGEESPAAPEARRILSEARAALAAWGEGEAGRLRLGAPARIDSREDHYVLVLPELELTDAQASLRLGTVLVAVMPQSDDTYALEVRLPARLGLAFAEHPDRIRPVSIRDHRITGR